MIRAALMLSMAIGCLGLGLSAPPIPAAATPDGQAKLAAAYLSTAVAEGDWAYTRFLSFYQIPEKLLPQARKLLWWWIHQMSFEQAVNLPREVPGSAGRLFALDLRDYRWNAQAWAAVAERDPYFEEPWIEHKTAGFLRLAAGYELPRKLIEAKRFPIVAITSAVFFFRDTIETDRSTSYYDLLFARERFAACIDVEVEEREDFYHPGGWTNRTSDGSKKNLPAGNYWRMVKKKAHKPGAFVDFPRDEDDWNKAFGIADTLAFLERQRIDTRRGAVVAGGRSDPKGGSVVAFQDRVLVILDTPLGWAGKTFDVADNAKFDPLEEGPNVAVGRIAFDASELLATLPNGGQAGLLINAQRKRIERGDAGIVGNKADARYVDVRNFMGCVQCHGPDHGFILPKDLVSEMLADGVDTKIKDREQRNAYVAFFQGLQKRVDRYRAPYKELLERTTADAEGKSWTAAELVKSFLELRNWYDDPVDVAQAVRDTGLAPDCLKLALVTSPRARLNWMLQGRGAPRRLWEQQLHRETQLLGLVNPEKRP